MPISLENRLAGDANSLPTPHYVYVTQHEMVFIEWLWRFVPQTDIHELIDTFTHCNRRTSHE